MDGYCSSCKEASQQLTEMLETRRRGQLYQPTSSDDTGIFARFGTIGDICSRKECPSCLDLAQEIARWESEDDWIRREDLVVGIQVETRERSTQRGNDVLKRQTLYVITQAPRHEDERWHLVNLYTLERGAPHDECGRLFDPHVFDLDMVKSWLRCCDLSHGEFCKLGLTDHLPLETFPARILLVDLENQCLAYGTLADNYVALSYVWGQTNTLRSTRANLHELFKPGSVDFSSQGSVIPATIKDFLKLAVRLEVPYAWVDCLCIVQDGEDMQEQLNGMAAIFSSTYLTIVAEGPDASFGLPGAGNGSKRRDTQCPMLRLPNMLCAFEDNALPRNRPKVWESRAWTFQEALFSRRILFIDVAGFLGWKCPRQYWHETHESPSESPDWILNHAEHATTDWRYLGFSDLNFDWPDMRRWCELALEYHGRAMSFDRDALRAIAGLMAVMDRMSPGGFFWGIPELFFDTFLLWDINGKTERKDCKEIPSWSFLGWKGGDLDLLWWRFSMHHTFIDDADKGFGCDCEVESIVQWLKQSEDFTKLLPIANKFDVYKSPSEDLVPTVPQKWTKHTSGEDGKVYYTVGSLVETHFRYPIPLRHEEAGAETVQFSHLLRFKAKRGSLNIGSAIKLNPIDGSGYWEDGRIRSLRDDSGKWAGVVHLHSLGSNAPIALSDLEGERFELIAIAKGRLRNDAFPKHTDYRSGAGWTIPECDCEERSKEAEEYEFYFVMCVDWNEGVAYRTGLGRVEKVVWEGLFLEDIDVTLG